MLGGVEEWYIPSVQLLGGFLNLRNITKNYLKSVAQSLSGPQLQSVARTLTGGLFWNVPLLHTSTHPGMSNVGVPWE